jgi:hypothetical protein
MNEPVDRRGQASTPRIALVAAVNNDAVLAANLMRSPVVQQGRASVSLQHHAPSAAIAYNRGLDETSEDVVVFAHQDVYLPEGWVERLFATIAALEGTEPSWAVIGVIGMALDGAMAGQIWCASNRGIIGTRIPGPVAVQSLDEIVIVLRRSSGLRFDESLPHFHLYATDIVQTARSSGLGSYVADLPVIHNSKPVITYWGGFLQAFLHLRRKWRDVLPIRTPVVTITPTGLDLLRRQFWLWRTRGWRLRQAIPPSADPAVVVAGLGFGLCDLPPTGACATARPQIVLRACTSEAHRIKQPG